MSIPNILVIDDDEARAERLAESLRLHGFHAKSASSGEAHELVRGGIAPDFAIVELMLQGTHGFELTRALRAAHPSLRVLLTSDYHFTETQLEKVDCGAMGFVARPFGAEHVADYLRGKVRAPSLSPAEQKL
ncbi:MAG: response regulator [Polyangiales bacterium]